MTTSTISPDIHRITLRFATEDWQLIKSNVETSGLTINAYFHRLALNVPVPKRRIPTVNRNYESTEDKRLTIRLKPEEWAIIDEDAQTVGLSRNAYLRQLALEAPLPRKRRVRVNEQHAQIYSKWLGELGKIGSNLNQISRNLHIANQKGDSSDTPDNQQVLGKIQEVESLLADQTKDILAELYSDKEA